jgi:hypothetical protein
MKLTLGMLAIVPMYILLLITSLIARTMAVVSAILASACIAVVFWTKSKKLIDYAVKKFGI